MPWVRYDDRYPSKREIRKLGDSAYRLHHSAVCWSSENGTDGFVGDDDLELASDVKDPRSAVQELERQVLWERRPDGWFILTFFEHAMSAEKVEQARALKTERQQRWRQSKGGSASVDASTPTSRDATRDASEDPAPTRPDPTHTTTSLNADGVEQDAPKPKRANPQKTAEGFDAFWKTYPRKVGKISAQKAYAKALANGTEPVAILEGARFYAMECKTRDPQFIKHPATWINAGCWEDEADPVYKPPVIGAPSAAATAQPPPFAAVIAQQSSHSNGRVTRASEVNWRDLADYPNEF